MALIYSCVPPALRGEQARLEVAVGTRNREKNKSKPKERRPKRVYEIVKEREKAYALKKGKGLLQETCCALL